MTKKNLKLTKNRTKIMKLEELINTVLEKQRKLTQKIYMELILQKGKCYIMKKTIKEDTEKYYIKLYEKKTSLSSHHHHRLNL